MKLVRKKRRVRKVKRVNRRDPEANWVRKRRSGGMIFGLMVAGLVLLSGGLGFFWMMQREREMVPAEAVVEKDEFSESIVSAEEVARNFLRETDPAKRLPWVRRADEVKTRMANYPLEAREEVGKIESMLGHRGEGDGTTTAFVVVFPSGTVRLLEVVGTPEGPRVDWDAYARYGTAKWEDLVSGKAASAVVRVFCEPSSERPEPFMDEGTAFRMSSPELPQSALAFATVGTATEEGMKKVVLGSPNFRQRFVLEVERHQGTYETLFVIKCCLAVGWVMGEKPVEEMWGGNGE